MKTPFAPVWQPLPGRLAQWRGSMVLALVLTALLATACARFLAPDTQPDPAVERLVAGLQQTNAELNRFTCVGRLTLSGSNGPAQSFRAAMAGQLPDRFRIDMLSAFGGSAGTVASDGQHLFWAMHTSGEYHKRRLGDGNLRRLIHLNLSVGDLLEMLVGRIPMDRSRFPRAHPDADGVHTHLDWVDRWGQTRQRITLDETLHPVRAQWFDGGGDPAHRVVLSGRQTIDGFVLPRQIDLFGPLGEQVSLRLERYTANAPLDQTLFTPALRQSAGPERLRPSPSASIRDGAVLTARGGR
jgi:hypothetical protein